VLFRELQGQPDAVRRAIHLERSNIDGVARLVRRRRIHFFGMGSSYFASLYATYLVAQFTANEAVASLASEFVHYPSAISPHDVSMVVSQSGESVETVGAARLLKRRGSLLIGVTNDVKSQLAKLSDHVVLLHAGEEKASSTKTFASTLAILYCLIASVARCNNEIRESQKQVLIVRLLQVIRAMDANLAIWNHEVKHRLKVLGNCRTAMVLARGPVLPAALQGALLLKEIAKIPAEGMSSGEFAHGPIETVGRNMGVVVLGGGSTAKLQRRLAFRVKELHARTMMVSPREEGDVDSITHGEADENLAVFPCAVILELLAYHLALKRRLDPDRFRVIRKVTTRE